MHNLSNCALSLFIEFIQFFWIVDFCCVDFRIAYKDSVPDFLFGLFKVEIQIIFAFDSFDFPDRFWSIDLFIQIPFDNDITVFIFNWKMFGFNLNFELLGLERWINFKCNLNLTCLLAPRILLIFTAIICIDEIDVYRSGGWRNWLVLGFWLCFCCWLICWKNLGLLCFRRKGLGWRLLWLLLLWRVFLLLLSLFVSFEFFVEFFNGFFGESFVVFLLELLKDA